MKINSDEPDPAPTFTSFEVMLQMSTEPDRCCTKKDLNYAYDFRLQGARFKRGLLSTGELLEQLRLYVNKLFHPN